MAIASTIGTMLTRSVPTGRSSQKSASKVTTM
jgi:hypothetical protein